MPGCGRCEGVYHVEVALNVGPLLRAPIGDLLSCNPQNRGPLDPTGRFMGSTLKKARTIATLLLALYFCLTMKP